MPRPEGGIISLWGGGGSRGAGGGGGLAQGLGIWLVAFGGAYWPLAIAHSDPLWVQICFGCGDGPRATDT